MTLGITNCDVENYKLKKNLVGGRKKESYKIKKRCKEGKSLVLCGVNS